MSILGVSRGPSPVSLGNQDTLPVAIALTESVNAYFKGADPTKLVLNYMCALVFGGEHYSKEM